MRAPTMGCCPPYTLPWMETPGSAIGSEIGPRAQPVRTTGRHSIAASAVRMFIAPAGFSAGQLPQQTRFWAHAVISLLMVAQGSGRAEWRESCKNLIFWAECQDLRPGNALHPISRR